MSPSMPNTEPESTAVHVAVGVIMDSDGEILIAKRHDDQHQGGLWEFPGGKVRGDEGVEDALSRELQEEVNIRPTGANSLLTI